MSNREIINIYYWKEENNFGDLAAPFILNEISDGVKFKYVSVIGFIEKLRKIKRGIFNDVNLNKNILLSLFQYQFKRNVLVSIGSILSKGDANCTYWGSGFMNKADKFNGGNTLAVRGYYSVRRLQELGYPKCDVVGDPALLLPLIVKPTSQKKYFISIIPHWKEVGLFKELYGNQYNIIDLRTDDIHGVIEEITSSQYVLSTSLHGIIVSHAYKIPALWIKCGDIGTDGFKFNDYFSSVNIKEYDGFNDYRDLLNKSHKEIEDFFIDHSCFSTPSAKIIEKIQDDLLSVAPFALSSRFRR